MGIYENPLSFGQEDQEDNQALGFDAIQHAAERQKERLKKQAEEKAVKEANETKKKAEKEARIAKKYADKATKELEKKTDKLADTTDQAKEKIAETKEAAAEISDHLQAAAAVVEQGKNESVPVEMNFTEGSEYIAELKEGEEAIFDLSQSAESVEKTVELADEVATKADALARARAALDEVVSDDMGVENNTLVESQDVFGIAGPEQDVRERLKHAWESSEQSSNLENNQSNSVEKLASSGKLPAPLTPSYAPETHDNVRIDSRVNEQPAPPESIATERRGTPVYQPMAAGYFAGKAQNFKQELRSTDSRLQTQMRELQSEISTAQVYPVPTLDIEAPAVVTQQDQAPSLRSEQPGSLPSVERVAGYYDAVPQWIKQLEVAIKRGTVPELKKWQKDVLKSQHPDLLKQYERLDSGVKQDMRRQSIEYSHSSFTAPTPKFSAGQTQPGDLPHVTHQMPAYMQTTPLKSPPVAPPVPQPQLSAYEYALNSRSDGSVFSNTYLLVVAVGGVLFGAVLISVFGL